MLRKGHRVERANSKRSTDSVARHVSVARRRRIGDATDADSRLVGDDAVHTQASRRSEMSAMVDALVDASPHCECRSYC